MTLEQAKEFFAADRFATYKTGITIDEVGENYAKCSFTATENDVAAHGGVMGGAIFTLADFTFAVASNNAHRPSVAQQVSLSFLNASKGKRLISTAFCIKSGRTSCVYRVEIKDDLGRDVAQAMFTGFKLT